MRTWQVPDLPEGTSGPWTVERIRISAAQRLTITDMIAGARDIPPGAYTILRHGNDTWMGDTPQEQSEHARVLDATGEILINGLGLGCLPNWLLQDPAVTSVDIVERDPDVIALVASHYEQKWAGRCRVHHGDAFTHVWPGRTFDLVAHDIWVAMEPENLLEMQRLHQRYDPVARAQWSWGYEEIITRLTS